MHKKLFITDLDGTLFTDDKRITGRDLRMLDHMRKQGVVTAIATGRSSYSFEKAFQLIGMLEGENAPAIDYVIFSTGAGIMEFEGRNLLLKHELSPEEIKPVTRYFDEQGFSYMVHRSIPDTRHFLYRLNGAPNPDFDSRLALYPEYASSLKNDYQFEWPATEVLAIVPPGRLNPEKISKIRKDLKDYSVIQATSPLDHSSTWIEVFCSSVSKSHAVNWLAGRIGVLPEHIVAVGNDYNDVDLLDIAAEGFVVDNAPLELKRRYRVVASNNNSGVSQAAIESSILDLTVKDL